MCNSQIKETTDILVTKCFGRAPFLKKGTDVKIDTFLKHTENGKHYTLGLEQVYSENEDEQGSMFNFEAEGDLEYVFYGTSAYINDSFTGNKASLDMFYLSEVKIPAEKDDDIYENISDYKNKLYSSPLYIEYLTLAGFKNGGGNVPRITVKYLDLDTLTDSVIYFKQPDIMLYNGEYVLPRDIPSLLLLEIYKLFSKKLGDRVIYFGSFSNSESLISNFINTALYNYRRDMVYLNFGSMIISVYRTDYSFYADTAVRLKAETYDIGLIFPEASLLSDLSDMRCVLDDKFDQMYGNLYLPKKIETEFFYNLPKCQRYLKKSSSRPEAVRRYNLNIGLLVLKSNKKILYVYSEFSDYLKLTVEGKNNCSYLRTAVGIERLPEMICGVSIVQNEKNEEEKEADRKKAEERKRSVWLERYSYIVEQSAQNKMPENPEDFEPAEAFKLLCLTDKKSNKLKDISALTQYDIIGRSVRDIFTVKTDIGSRVWGVRDYIKKHSNIICSEADYKLDTYLYEYRPSSYVYSKKVYSAVDERTEYKHILVINNKVYTDKNICGMELDMLLQTLKQPRELTMMGLLDKVKLMREIKDTDSVFNACDQYIKQEFAPRTDSFHIQSIALKLKNYQPLCVTTVMAEDIISLDDYLADVLGFFENNSLTKEEYEKIYNGNFENLSFGDFKRFAFMYQSVSVLLSLYEILYIKICREEADNLKCIGEIIDDRYFIDKRDENNEGGETSALFSFDIKNTRFDFMLHHEYDLYKNLTYSTASYHEDKPFYTRPSYMEELYLMPSGEISCEEGDDVIIKDFWTKRPTINFSHINPNNKYWYYKILLDKGISGMEIREKEILSFDCVKDLSCDDILLNLKNRFKEINEMLINTSKYTNNMAVYALYSQIAEMINRKKADLKKEGKTAARSQLQSEERCLQK